MIFPLLIIFLYADEKELPFDLFHSDDQNIAVQVIRTQVRLFSGIYKTFSFCSQCNVSTHFVHSVI